MIHMSTDTTQPKGWLFGPWNSPIPIAIGFANQGIAERHYHAQMYEVYLVARGTSVADVNGQQMMLQAGDALAVEPHEVHTFRDSSPDYLHFVLHVPFVAGDKIVLAE